MNEIIRIEFFFKKIFDKMVLLVFNQIMIKFLNVFSYCNMYKVLFKVFLGIYNMEYIVYDLVFILFQDVFYFN